MIDGPTFIKLQARCAFNLYAAQFRQRLTATFRPDYILCSLLVLKSTVVDL